MGGILVITMFFANSFLKHKAPLLNHFPNIQSTPTKSFSKHDEFFANFFLKKVIGHQFYLINYYKLIVIHLFFAKDVEDS